MSDRLVIPQTVATALLEHARAALPHEACGLLSGDRAAGRAWTFHPARNAHRSSLRYEMDPDDLVRLVLGIDAAGEDLVAIVHSHVGTAAVPSAADRREARYPDALQLIVSLRDPSADPATALRAWRLGGDVVTEVDVVIA